MVERDRHAAEQRAHFSSRAHGAHNLRRPPRKIGSRARRETRGTNRHPKDMKSSLAVFASAAAGFASLFGSFARAQGAAPSLTAAHASPRLQLDLPVLLHLEPLREPGFAGLNLRLRAIGQVAPFVEGRLGDGVVAARPDGALVIPGTPVGLNGALGPSGMLVRGVDVGVDVHRFERGYLSVAIGWLRSSARMSGFDTNDRQFSCEVWRDALLFKVGLTM